MKNERIAVVLDYVSLQPQGCGKFRNRAHLVVVEKILQHLPNFLLEWWLIRFWRIGYWRRWIALKFREIKSDALFCYNVRLHLVAQRMKFIAKYGRNWRLRVRECEVVQFLQFEGDVHRAIVKLRRRA